MKLFGSLLIGPNEKLLKQSLDDIDRLRLDAVCATLNNVDDNTKIEVKKRGYIVHEDNREWGLYQPQIKQDATLRLEQYAPDWVITKDTDEIFDQRLSRQVLENLAVEHAAYRFYYVSLWDNEQTWMPALSGWRVRFYKFRPAMPVDFGKRPLHVPLAPQYACSVAQNAPFLSLHHGLMTQEDRDARKARHALYDPKGLHTSIIYRQALQRTHGISLQFGSDGLPTNVIF